MNTLIIPSGAVKIRPVRLKDGNISEFNTIHLKSNASLNVVIKRLGVIGELKSDDAKIVLDLLDEDNSIIAEVKVGRPHLEYLRRTFKLKVVS